MHVSIDINLYILLQTTMRTCKASCDWCRAWLKIMNSVSRCRNANRRWVHHSVSRRPTMAHNQRQEDLCLSRVSLPAALKAKQECLQNSLKTWYVPSEGAMEKKNRSHLSLGYDGISYPTISHLELASELLQSTIRSGKPPPYPRVGKGCHSSHPKTKGTGEILSHIFSQLSW